MRKGKLKERVIKLVHKHSRGTNYYYAEPGEDVYWGGGKAEHPELYGKRELYWCELWSGEPIGLAPEEVEWDED